MCRLHIQDMFYRVEAHIVIILLDKRRCGPQHRWMDGRIDGWVDRQTDLDLKQKQDDQ